ncbi:54S ribosomal protein L2 mitochondrial, partial [Dispira simplex]
VGIGRDHTLFALTAGYVHFYRQKGGRYQKERRYIAVSHNKDAKFPRDPEAPRDRRFELMDVNEIETQLKQKQAEYCAYQDV